MQSDSDIADYTQRVAQAWASAKRRRRWCGSFCAHEDRKMFIQVGYGLKGALPDATAFDITERRMKPLVRAGKMRRGWRRHRSDLQSNRGGCRGSSEDCCRTPPQQQAFRVCCRSSFLSLCSIIISRVIRKLGGYGYSSRGGGPVFIPSGGGWSSGGGSGGGFSGFGGGGGSFGGGGAGSSW